MLALTVVLDGIGFAVPFVRANQVALFAFVFLWLPQRIVPREGPSPEEFGLTFAGAPRGLLVGAGWAALLFVAFVPAFHAWNVHGLGQQLHWDAGAYQRPDDRYFGEPATVDPGIVAVYHQYDVLVVYWSPEDGPWRVEINSDGELWTLDHRPLGAATGIDCVGSTCSSRGTNTRVFRAQFRVTGSTYVDVVAYQGGSELPLQSYQLGVGVASGLESPGERGVRLRLGLGWLPMALLLQVLLIALPEEFFYRGYLQRRLDQIRGRSAWRLGPLEITKSNLVVSALFALGHFVIGFSPLRLAVFFPSLLFGILRDRTNGIAAPIAFHAACNLMVQITALHYWG
jgi:membrane protease YdiL (CAAX protease family)